MDVKWLFGVLLTLALLLSVFLYDLYMVTSRDQAQVVYGTLAGQFFSETEESFSLVKSWAAEHPDQFIALPAVTPIQLDIRGRDIRDLTYEEFVDEAAAAVGERIYNDEIDPGLLGLQTSEVGLASIVGIFDRETHEKIGVYFTISAVVAGLLAVPLVAFSYGFGRLANPGIALAGAGLPGLLLLQTVNAVPLGGEMARLSAIIDMTVSTHQYLMLAAAAAVGVGVAAGMVRRLLRSSRFRGSLGPRKGQLLR